MTFFLDCVPPKTSHHAKRIVRFGRFSKLADKPELTAARGDLLTLLQPHQPAAPMDGPLMLRLIFTWPWRASDSKRVRGAGLPIWYDTGPDLDNLAKTFIDCMARLAFFPNDSRIASLHLAKFIGDRPGVDVDLREAT